MRHSHHRLTTAKHIPIAPIVLLLSGGRAACIRRPWFHHQLARFRIQPEHSPSEAVSCGIPAARKNTCKSLHAFIIKWIVFASGRAGALPRPFPRFPPASMFPQASFPRLAPEGAIGAKVLTIDKQVRLSRHRGFGKTEISNTNFASPWLTAAGFTNKSVPRGSPRFCAIPCGSPWRTAPQGSTNTGCEKTGNSNWKFDAPSGQAVPRDSLRQALRKTRCNALSSRCIFRVFVVFSSGSPCELLVLFVTSSRVLFLCFRCFERAITKRKEAQKQSLHCYSWATHWEITSWRERKSMSSDEVPSLHKITTRLPNT